jgi:GT2 family glycosyltransferase
MIRSVSVAVLSWNGRHHLEHCLPALAAQRDPGVPWEVLVLDNGSTDATAEWVRRRHPEVRLIESRRNLGFCAGNGRLVAAASGDAVAFLNNDTRPEPGWLAALVDALGAAPADVAAVSGLILDWEGERLDFARGVMTFDGHAFQLGFRRRLDRLRGGEIPAEGAELFFACGGNMLIKKASFLAAGGFDPDYFAYLEDVDLGWRLWSGGERVTFAREAVVRHRSGATSDLLGLYHRGFLFERNAFLTAYKNFDAELWPRVMPAVLLAFNSRTQTLLEQNNPAGALLAIDPYAGHIANTGPEAEGEEGRTPGAAGAARREPATDRGHSGGPGTAASRPAETTSRERQPSGLRAALVKARALGAKEAGRRVVRRLLGLPGAPLIADPRTQAQLRAQAWLLRHLDRAAAARHAVQQRRRVPDREIFARFPPYLVPTYPGDEALFAGPGFRDWLPDELPLVESTLGEVMEMGSGPATYRGGQRP